MTACISGLEDSRSTRTTLRPSGHLRLSNLKTLMRSAVVMLLTGLVLSTITASCLAAHDTDTHMQSAKRAHQRRTLPLMLKDFKISPIMKQGYGGNRALFCEHLQTGNV